MELAADVFLRDKIAWPIWQVAFAGRSEADVDDERDRDKE
jgi:hypothetical protein